MDLGGLEGLLTENKDKYRLQFWARKVKVKVTKQISNLGLIRYVHFHTNVLRKVMNPSCIQLAID